LIHQTRQFSGFINEATTKDAQLFMSFHIEDKKDKLHKLSSLLLEKEEDIPVPPGYLHTLEVLGLA